MAEKVFLHVGAPKTGTTYLQELMHLNRKSLEAVGVRYAEGRFPNDRVWASEALRDFKFRTRPQHAAGAWDRIVEQVTEWPGTAVVSHEFLGACTKAQAARAHRDLAPAEVHVVLTARDYAKQVAAVWQERLKYGYPTPFSEFTLDNRTPAWSWRTQDVPRILDRWRQDLPVERVHLVTVPSGGPPDALWTRFASVIGAESAEMEGLPAANTSLGLVEAELLRRLDVRLRKRGVLDDPTDRTRLVRDVLANKVLSQGSRERFSVTGARLDELVARARDAVADVRSAGYDVVGSLDDLVPDLAGRDHRIPDDATAEELVEASLDAIAGLLLELKENRRAGRGGGRGGRAGGPPAPSLRGGLRQVARALRARVR